jgi:hypothetical protein
MADNTFDWPEELPEPDFVMFPKVYFRAIFPHLTPVERSVFELLMFAAYEYGRGVADRSVRDLIAGTGLSRASVFKALGELERVHLIAVEHRTDKRGGTDANLYRVRISNDPRFVGRDGGPAGRLPRTDNDIGASNERTPPRARSSPGKNHSKNPPTPILNDAAKFARGRYAVCPVCGARPCTTECAAQTLPA